MFVTDKVDDFLYKFVCHPIMVIYLDIQFRCLLIEQSKTLAGIMFGIQRIQIRVITMSGLYSINLVCYSLTEKGATTNLSYNKITIFEKVKEIKAKKNLDGIELQVNAKNKAAYEMYCNYGFTEKSINMELL